MTTSISKLARLGSGAALLLLPLLAQAAWNELNLTRGVTPYSETVYDLHMMMLWLCVAIGVLVFGAMFYSILKYRKSKGEY